MELQRTAWILRGSFTGVQRRLKNEMTPHMGIPRGARYMHLSTYLQISQQMNRAPNYVSLSKISSLQGVTQPVLWYKWSLFGPGAKQDYLRIKANNKLTNVYHNQK